MATRDITKRRYTQEELEPELVELPEEDARDDHDSVEKWRLLWEHRSHLYRWAVIGAVASTIIVFLLPVRYTTTTRLMPPDQAGQGIASMVAALGKASEIGSLGSELLGVKTSGDLFVGVLRSQTVENGLVNKFDLRKEYGERRYQDARKTLEDRTDITTDKKSGILTLKVSDRDPKQAAAMGHEYIEQLNRVVIDLDTSAAHRERMFLETRLKEVQDDLEKAEKEFSQFASKNTTIDVKEQSKAMITAAGELEGQLIAAQTELEGLRQIYTSNNVRVRSVQARIDEYQRQLKKLGGQTPDSTGAGASGTDAAGLANSDLYPSIRQLPILGVTWADLYRRTKVEEAVFETLTKQYEMARVEEAREVPSVKVLDPADVPEKKSFPPRALLIICGILLCVIGAGAWLIATARWERFDPADPRKLLATEIADSVKATWKKGWERTSRS